VAKFIQPLDSIWRKLVMIVVHFVYLLLWREGLADPSLSKAKLLRLQNFFRNSETKSYFLKSLNKHKQTIIISYNENSENYYYEQETNQFLRIKSFYKIDT